MSAPAFTMTISVDGEGLTDLVRNLVLSGDTDKAWRVLSAGVPDASAHHVAILMGDKRFDGDSAEGGLRIVRDRKSKKYKATLREMFAGRIRVDGRWWQPVARVVHFGVMDAEYAAEEMERPENPDADLVEDAPVAAMRDWWRARVRYYAHEDERVFDVGTEASALARADRELRQASSAFAIFEPCGEPPFWWTPARSPTEALAEYLAVGRRLRLERAREVPLKARIVARAFEGAFDGEDDECEEDLARERAWTARVADLRQKIVAQAAGDLFELKLGDGRVFQVPRAPFWHWALRRTSREELAPPWSPVSPSGLKLDGDDRYHTDWMIGAGIDLGESYDKEVREASINAMADLQMNLCEYTCAVLVDGPLVTGVVGRDIVVLPDLSPEREPLLRGARAVITETGGALAHVSVLARERGVPVMRVPDAVRAFPSGTRVTIVPSEGRIDAGITYAEPLGDSR